MTYPAPADPDRHALYRARWLADGNDPALADHPALAAIFGNSPFLSECALASPETVAAVLADGPDAALAAEFETLDGVPHTLDAVRRDYRLARRRIALIVALADIGQVWPVETVTRALSDFADRAVTAGLAALLAAACARGEIAAADPADSGMVVLAVGKLGARELNYSSDIDLVVFYDEERFQAAAGREAGPVAAKLARALGELLEARTGDGYVFRVDLRLRPDPNSTPAAVSVAAAEAYYGSLGQNWERAAMIRARLVAGDPASAARVTDIFTGWIWRRHLDYAAIADIHSIKRQIHSHRGHASVAVEGHNIKLGRGGIREIEFFVQTQQLIHGGRDPRLRVSGTLDALDALAAAGHVAPATARALADAYHNLRRLEHRIQMHEDRQTHSLPADPAEVDRLAVFLGRTPADFRAQLTATLTLVQRHYAALFEDAPSLSRPGNLVFTGTEDDPDTLTTLRGMGFQNAPTVAEAIRGWHYGRYRATHALRARQLLTELVPALLEAFGATVNPDLAFVAFDRFLARLPAGVPVFSLIHNRPELLSLMAEIMGQAPGLTEFLCRQPALLDYLIRPGVLSGWPTRAEMAAELDRQLSTGRDLQDALDLTRRFVQERQFLAGLLILRGAADGDSAGPFLAALAEIAIERLQTAVEADFARAHGRVPGGGLSILALGKLGSREMTIGADLDLIAVYEAPEDAAQSDGERPLAPSDYFTRLTQRLITALTALTPEGRLYEIDTRLRPSGNKGPLAVSLPAFTRYQETEAWTWEHMALTRARAVTGPEPLRRRIETALRRIIARPRDAESILRDVADMRQRIAAEHPPLGPWDLKYRPGGFIDIEFTAQAHQLIAGAARQGRVETDTAAALTALAAEGRLPEDAAAALVDTLRLWRRLLAFMRLVSPGRFEAATMPDALRQGVVRAAAPVGEGGKRWSDLDFAAFEAKMAMAADRSHALFRQLVEPASQKAEGLPS